MVEIKELKKGEIVFVAVETDKFRLWSVKLEEMKLIREIKRGSDDREKFIFAKCSNGLNLYSEEMKLISDFMLKVQNK